MALEYYPFILRGAKGAVVQSTYSMLSPHPLNIVPLDSSQLAFKTLLFPQWLKKADRSKKENVGFAQLFPGSPFGSRSQREGRRWPVSVEGATRGSVSQDAGGWLWSTGSEGGCSLPEMDLAWKAILSHSLKPCLPMFLQWPHSAGGVCWFHGMSWVGSHFPGVPRSLITISPGCIGSLSHHRSDQFTFAGAPLDSRCWVWIRVHRVVTCVFGMENNLTEVCLQIAGGTKYSPMRTYFVGVGGSDTYLIFSFA